MKSSAKGCGTCKERRILCDRKSPECLQCIRSKRTCMGYELRLSWPAKNNRKRAMLGKASPLKSNESRISTSGLRTVNVTSWDIVVYNYLANPGTIQCPLLPIRPSLSPFKAETNYDLLQYFDLIASNSLVACRRDEGPKLQTILIRIALSKDSPYSNAVLKSLFAFSAIHRYGLHTYADKLKQAALSTLTALTKGGVQDNEVIFHVATLMLLCCFEIQQRSGTSSQWLCYISSIKSLLGATQIKPVDHNSDIETLLYWVYYHDSLAQFSIDTWKRPHLPKEHKLREVKLNLKKKTLNQLLDISTSPCLCPILLSMLSEISDLVQKPRDERSPDVLLFLEWKILKLVPKTTDGQTGEETQETKTQHVFTLALLVYLERASGGIPETSKKLSMRLEKGFVLLSQLDSLVRLFPLFILGCEARSDEDRLVVLDLISRTKDAAQARNLGDLEEIIQSVWAQDDLGQLEVGYLDKLEAVLGSRDVLLSFA